MTQTTEETTYSIGIDPRLDFRLTEDDLSYLRFPSYDFNAGDRRFSSAIEAFEYARKQARLSGRHHYVRHDPGSYSFQELFLVQSAERVEVVL